MEAIVLAGGLGTRLQAAVPEVPKPMAPIKGRPFLERVLCYWSAQGIARVILSIGYKADTIQRYFGKTCGQLEIEYAIEEVPLGTGGGLLLASERLREQGPFLLLNGDTFFEVDLKTMVAAHLDKRAELTVALLRLPQTGRYQGVILGSDSSFVGFGAGAIDLESCLVNGGVYLFEKAILIGHGWNTGDKLSLESDMLPTWMEGARRVYGHISNGRFIDIGVPEDYYAAGALLCDGPTVSP